MTINTYLLNNVSNYMLGNTIYYIIKYIMSNNKYTVLHRIGYGSNFNKISIDKTNNIIKKEYINTYGKTKIDHEIRFYNFLIDNNIQFKIPKIYSFLENGYTMEYCYNYEPLYKVFNKLSDTKQKNLLYNIKNNLNLLHNSFKKKITKEEYYHHLTVEIYDKLIKRFNSIQQYVDQFSFIKTVNGVYVYSFIEVINMLNTYIIKLLDNKSEDDFYLAPIHGDNQFNNILYNIEQDVFVFIDPRGYYGDSEIYGIPEYDYAKLLFALSGYDEFDNRDITSLDILDININININLLDSDVLNINDISALLMYTIWLGNAECFIHKNYEKGIYSYFISLYLATLFINKNKLNIISQYN